MKHNFYLKIIQQHIFSCAKMWLYTYGIENIKSSGRTRDQSKLNLADLYVCECVWDGENSAE